MDDWYYPDMDPDPPSPEPWTEEEKELFRMEQDADYYGRWIEMGNAIRERREALGLGDPQGEPQEDRR